MPISESTLDELIAAAKIAAGNAYCPSSGFQVGAAVLTTAGKICTGCNVENASYRLTVCAEQNAIAHAVCEGMQVGDLECVVVYTPTETPTAPCGACRQTIYEFGPQACIVCVCDGDDVIDTTIGELLPEAFGPHNLADIADL